MLLLLALGAAVLVPGATMRLEELPAPSPLVRVHLCRTASGAYKGSGRACGAKEDDALRADAGQLQAFALHRRMLVTGVEYMPVLVLPDRALRGHVDLRLVSAQGRAELFSLTQRLDGPGVVGHRPDWTEATAFSQFRGPGEERSDCNSIERGCLVEFDEPMRELMLEHTRFSVEAAVEQPLEVFAAGLTLEVRTAIVEPGPADPGDVTPSAPAIFLTFRQAELSFVQERGVHLVLVGAAITFAGVAVWWGRALLHREKAHHH